MKFNVVHHTHIESNGNVKSKDEVIRTYRQRWQANLYAWWTQFWWEPSMSAFCSLVVVEMVDDLPPPSNIEWKRFLCFLIGHQRVFTWRRYNEHGFHRRRIDVACFRCLMEFPGETHYETIDNEGNVEA